MSIAIIVWVLGALWTYWIEGWPFAHALFWPLSSLMRVLRGK